MDEADICIIGGGPAGMVAGLLFARAGLKTIVLEKHADFLRDFRGDTVHPSTLRIFHELGLLDGLLARPHQKLRTIGGRIGGRHVRLADFTALRVPAPYIALMPQWDFLDFVAGAARLYPCFSLRQRCAGTDLIEENRRVIGVRTTQGDSVRAGLVIACDGRDSSFRAGLPAISIGAPMDVFWFRIPKHEAPENASLGVFDAGRIFVLIDRGDYYQCAFVFAKGRAEQVRNEGLEAFLTRVTSVGSETKLVRDSVKSWDDVKLLTVTVDRLQQWHRPGLLVIGDAAHAMSPIGGVGINLAIQDAVAAANILAWPMAEGRAPDSLLHRVQERRMLPVKVTQAMQKLVQDRIIAPTLSTQTAIDKPPLAARMLDRIAFLRRLPAWLIGMGVRPEHVRSPAHPPQTATPGSP